MRTSASRALRITATLAGAAAITATFTGTATAATGADGADGGSGSYNSGQDGESAEAPEAANENLDGETMSPRFHQPGLVTFDAPTLKTD